jgi:SPP1 gp7 family putative phage head morphogenesis protein
MRALRKGEKALPPVLASAAIQAAYKRALFQLTDEMAKSYARLLKAQYRETPPRIADLAMDRTPADMLADELKKLGKRWLKRFNQAAPKLANWFAKEVDDRSQRVLKKILRDAGISVRFTMTKEMRDVADATVQENVSLIRSIATEYHTQVEGIVMRSVTRGRDLEDMVKELQGRFGIERRRAELIALDQNNKATAAFRRVRELELGLDVGIWLHSHAGKDPRPTHIANHGKRFSVKDGWFDSDPKVRRAILPGELIRCRCSWRPVVKGFT